MHEARYGYPAHMWMAIGHMCHAEEELDAVHTEIAMLVHKHRKAYEASDGEYDVPVLKIIERLCALAAARDA